jgi:hypothetical protein
MSGFDQHGLQKPVALFGEGAAFHAAGRFPLRRAQTAVADGMTRIRKATRLAGFQRPSQRRNLSHALDRAQLLETPGQQRILLELLDQALLQGSEPIDLLAVQNQQLL